MAFGILTLNLHSYQEGKRDGDSIAERIRSHTPIFERIASTIIELDVDVVCLQEVGEWREELETRPYGQAASNAARHIQQRTGNAYQLVQDWSHYAWNTWREGTAVLSKWPIRKSASRYVTHNQTKTWWKSRNITMAQVDVPTIGLVNLFSVHTGWWDDPDEPFQAQFDTLAAWADEEDGKGIVGTFLCGDFNIPAGSAGYTYVVGNGRYTDPYLQANPNGMYDATIGQHIDGWEGRQDDAQRIDYIFMKYGSHLKVQSANIIFTESRYGRVSDHAGIYAVFSA
ncbi:MAG: endonuclease/exonuclease/phosphatase family protein [Ardenticatenaceae bacterium]|nr:endonuclease/exonuclease/phosphatase family protein [Anaerolineales bacterium]MCB8923782.1 endonuclease/exonuclease/phosphatase family protein [Ardenticatenaceae bacterium]MCB8990117.1 endonuclease/exonuclease/phosphatase family protein [Ardenticatenaceae bacterium]